MKLLGNDLNSIRLLLEDEGDTVTLGQYIGQTIGSTSFVVYLDGDLGAGKTTLSRGIVQAFGHKGAVKSPTFTLVEPYELKEQNIYHFDLYRMASPDELYYLGLEDYFARSSYLCLVEWPQKGLGVLPEADWRVKLDYQGEQRCITISLNTNSPNLPVAQTKMDEIKQTITQALCKTRSQ
jgi:tRNA threonylcarbamoyladenosine biosynthesis protein TsaE